MLRLATILLIFPFFAVAQNFKVVNNQPPVRLNVSEILEKAGVKSIRCIFKDSRKLIWFCTGNGLFRFDGTNVLYTRHIMGDSISLPDNTINNMVEDRNGDLWIGTNGGVARLNAYNLKCTVYNETNERLNKNFDNKIFVDQHSDIWCGNQMGLEKLNKNTNKFELVWADMIDKQPGSKYVTTIADYDTTHLILGSFTDIIFINKNDFSFRRIPIVINSKIVQPAITALFTDPLKNVWIGTWGFGFIKYVPDQGKMTSWNWEPDLPTNNDNIVYNFGWSSSEAESSLWIGTYDGLIKISPDQFPIKNGAIYTNLSEGPNDQKNSFHSVLVDESSTMWLGGEKVFQLNINAPEFKTVRLPLKGEFQDMQSCILGSTKYYVISSWHTNSGLTILDSNLKVLKQLSDLPTENPGDEQNISGLAVDKFQRIWLSTLSGVFVLNKDFKIIHQLSGNNNSTGGLTKKKTNGIFIHHDTVWIVLYRKGLDLFDLNFHKLIHFEKGGNEGLNDEIVWKLSSDKKGNLWLVGNTVIYRFDPIKVTFKNYPLSDENTGCFPHDIAELPDGSLLVASEKGLIHFDPTTGKYLYLNSPLLKREENIISVAVDVMGNTWYLTNDHLVFYDFKKKKVSLFGREDGIDPEKKFYIIRQFNNRFFIPQSGQLVSFDSSIVTRQTCPPEIFISKIQVNDSSISMSKPVSFLDLKYNQNKVQIEFAGIDYYKPDQNQYASYLEGVDKDWIYTDKNFVYYTNLPPGKYLLHLKAANFAGQWSKSQILTLLIHPPFWKTWWFISLVVLITGSLFVLVIRYISQRNLKERILILEKEHAVERERNRIAKDMHDDLGSGLTKIAIMSEVAKKQLDTPVKAINQLENISTSSRELIDNLQDIVWVLNPRNDTLDSLAAYIREYALKFFESIDIRVKFDYPVNIPLLKLSEEVRRNIFLVIKETFTNIAKHASCDFVTVELKIINGSFEIRICDNGKGFERSRVRNFANGLQNMQTRIQQIGGKFKLDAFPGRGTETLISINN